MIDPYFPISFKYRILETCYIDRFQVNSPLVVNIQSIEYRITQDNMWFPDRAHQLFNTTFIETSLARVHSGSIIKITAYHQRYLFVLFERFKQAIDILDKPIQPKLKVVKWYNLLIINNL